MLDDEAPVDEDLFKSLIMQQIGPSISTCSIYGPRCSPTGRGVTGYALDDETPDDEDLERDLESLGMSERLAPRSGSVPFVLGIRKIVLILFI